MLAVLFRVLISFVLLFFVLRGIDLAKLWLHVSTMNLWWLALALLAYAATMMVAAWRWQRLLRAQHIDVSQRRLAESCWVSLFFNNFLPSNIGGDVIRIADTASAAGSKTLATTVVLVDRALGLAALTLIAAIGSIAAAAAGVRVPGARWLWIAAGAGFVAALAFVLAPETIRHLLAPLRALDHPWIAERTDRLEEAARKFHAAPAAVLGAFGGAVAVQATMVGFFLLTARGLEVPLPMLLGAVLIPVSLAVQMVPVSINGFGVREAVFAFFFGRFGLPTDAAVALSLVSTGLVMALSLVGGGLFLMRKNQAGL